MQAHKTKTKAHYRIPQIGPKFPAAAFFGLLLAGFVCLYAASRMHPNYTAIRTYRDDPAYSVTSRLFLKVQSFSNVIAAGNSRTVSEIAALAHKLVLKPAEPKQRPLKRRELPKH